jgi:hypothetical protein
LRRRVDLRQVTRDRGFAFFSPGDLFASKPFLRRAKSTRPATIRNALAEGVIDAGHPMSELPAARKLGQAQAPRVFSESHTVSATRLS